MVFSGRRRQSGPYRTQNIQQQWKVILLTSRSSHTRRIYIYQTLILYIAPYILNIDRWAGRHVLHSSDRSDMFPLHKRSAAVAALYSLLQSIYTFLYIYIW